MAVAQTPIHLAANNAPVIDEVTIESRGLIGAVPAELSGRYFRNGPNPRTGWSAHMFDGDGMLHAIALDGGRARWYRNRYVRTPLFEHPGETRMALAFDRQTSRIDYRVSTANTHIVAHAGRLLALEEGGFPYEATPDLDTVGPFTFGGALRTPMTAHPKTCPRTGDLLFFGYQLRAPYVTYYRASAAGEIVDSQVVAVPRATMMHDFAITASHVIFMDSPIVFDAGGAAAGGAPWRWDDSHGARFGVMPRDGDDREVRWFEVEPSHLSHTANAVDAGDQIVIVGTRLPRAPGAGEMGGLPAMHQWTLNLGTGHVGEAPLDDEPSEYPRIAESRIGLHSRYAYTTSFVLEAAPHHSEIYKYDLAHGASRTTHTLPPGHTCGEPVFVPRTGGASQSIAEDDGYLVAFAHDRGRGTSYLVILDASDIETAPVAQVHLPVRVPGGFHGTWLPDSSPHLSG